MVQSTTCSQRATVTGSAACSYAWQLHQQNGFLCCSHINPAMPAILPAVHIHHTLSVKLYTKLQAAKAAALHMHCAPSTALLGDPAGMSEGPACVTLHAATHTNCSEQQSLLTTLQNTTNKSTLTTPDWSLVQMSQVGKSAQSRCKTHTRLVTTTHTRNNRQTQSPAHTRFIVLSDTHTLSHKHTAMSAVWRPSSSPTQSAFAAHLQRMTRPYVFLYSKPHSQPAGWPINLAS